VLQKLKTTKRSKGISLSNRIDKTIQRQLIEIKNLQRYVIDQQSSSNGTSNKQHAYRKIATIVTKHDFWKN